MNKLSRLVLWIAIICMVFSGCAAASLPNNTLAPNADMQTNTGFTTVPTAEPTIHPTIEATVASPTEAETAPATEPATQPPTQPTVAETAPIHVHDYSPATCLKPKTCDCGATVGKVGSHSWQDATCAEPKTCSTCGKTTGSASGHNYADGVCTVCGKTVSADATMVWIPTKGGKKYHSKESCSNMSDPKQVTKEEAEEQGFEPCKRCH